MSQLSKGHTYGATTPDNQVTYQNLNALVDDAQLASGAITEQTELASTAADDLVLLTDTSNGNALRKVQLSNLTPANGVTLAKLAAEVAAFLLPVGSMILYPVTGGTPPTGFLIANGQAVSRATYAALFALYGTTHGAGDGVTTFNLPNMNRRVPVGAGGTGTAVLGNAVGNTGGEETHTLTEAELPAHSHLLPYYGDTGTDTQLAVTLNGNASPSTYTNPAGSGDSHNNVQPSLVTYYIVKF